MAYKSFVEAFIDSYISHDGLFSKECVKNMMASQSSEREIVWKRGASPGSFVGKILLVINLGLTTSNLSDLYIINWKIWKGS